MMLACGCPTTVLVRSERLCPRSAVFRILAPSSVRMSPARLRRPCADTDTLALRQREALIHVPRTRSKHCSDRAARG